MPATPQNCFFCKTPWRGKGPMCDNCRGIILTPPVTPICSYCGGFHDTADCLKAAISYLMPRTKPYISSTTYRRRGRMPYDPAPLKYCNACKSNYLIESKAGNICTGCHAVVHNPCRNCTSQNTHGVTGDSTQFIECGDCQFIE